MNAIDFHTLLTVLFFVVFIGMVVWVYWPGRKGTYDRAAQLPFNLEEGCSTHTGGKGKQ